MEPTEPITIRASKDVINQIDTLAAGMDRSQLRGQSGHSAIPIITSYTGK
jgi:hypothetical protein